MEENLLIIHGGGPTAVINASLYGAVMQAKSCGRLTHIYGAKNGTGGFLREQLLPLEQVSDSRLSLLLQTPGSAIGTSRDALSPEDYGKMTELLKKHHIKYVLMNGGNGTMDACAKLWDEVRRQGADIFVMGIPKTMDNDIALTDHSPGYGSAARFMAQSTRELCADVAGLPIHVVVMEALGRNAGWVTASAALAQQSDGTCTPDLICLPEVPFEEERFLSCVSDLLTCKKGIVAVVSEGLKTPSGEPIVPPIFQVGRATYFGDVSAHLANLIIQKLGYKARSEKPGLLGRASMALSSDVDREEAILAGKIACKAVLEGQAGRMPAFRRCSHQPYVMEPYFVDIHDVMLTEKTMPPEYIAPDGFGVTAQFIQWCRPLIGAPLPETVRFN